MIVIFKTDWPEEFAETLEEIADDDDLVWVDETPPPVGALVRHNSGGDEELLQVIGHRYWCDHYTQVIACLVHCEIITTYERGVEFEPDPGWELN